MNEEDKIYQGKDVKYGLKKALKLGYKDGLKEGFQKGKLEQKKEELERYKDLLVKYNSRWLRKRVKEIIEQLQKEIGEEKQDE